MCRPFPAPSRAVRCFVFVAFGIALGPAHAEPPHDSHARPASYERATPQSSTVRFGRRTQRVGDQLEQTLAVALELDTVVRQGRDVIDQGRMSVRRHQRRRVTTTEVSDGMPLAVLVRYLEATKTTTTGAAEAGEGAVKPQPVQGKAYRCRREGDTLHVTDEAGNIPPLDEYEIVAANMDSLGRVNPLAEYLAGRTVAIGDKLSLPRGVGEKLLGLGDELGRVTRFDLTLAEVRDIDGVRCAVFNASVEAASSDSSQMLLQVDGPLAVQIDTCRAVQANFTGPIGMSETRGSLTATYQLTGTGKMHVRIASVYRDVQR